MRISLICNPQSGRGVAADGTADELRRFGAEIVETASTPTEARGEGADRIVVVAGDGTLAPAAALAARRGLPLAVVPAGTANDFARAVDLPLDQDQAIRLAAEGERTRPLELAFMGDRPFLNVASAGLAPAAAARAEPLKDRIGPLAYVVGALMAGARERPITCRADVDGRELFHGSAWQLTIASGGAFGGGAEIDAAEPDDGRLDLVVVPGGSRLQLPLRGIAMRRGTLAEQDGVVHARGDEIVVDVPAGTRFNVDGEVVIAEPRTRFSVRRAAFELIVP